MSAQADSPVLSGEASATLSPEAGTMASSRDILIQTEDLTGAAAFYEQVLGLERVVSEENLIGLEAGPLRLYLDRGPALGPVLEFFVPDLAEARSAVLAAGGTVVREDPEVPRCYLLDPYGLCFNLAERKPGA